MNKFTRLVLIGTVLTTFIGLQVLTEKYGGRIFYWIGIALFVAFAKRLRTARQGAGDNQTDPRAGSGCKIVLVGDESQTQQSSA